MAYTIIDNCVACGTCVEECPNNAIQEGEEIYKINPDDCTECGVCVEICPVGAIMKE